MKTITYLEISELEGQIINDIMRQRKIRQVNLAKELSISQATVSNFLKGYAGIESQKAYKLYELLGQNESTKFLVGKNGENSAEIKCKWNELYDSYMNNLKQVYEKSPNDKKFLILGGLERLAEENK